MTVHNKMSDLQHHLLQTSEVFFFLVYLNVAVDK